MKAGFIGCGNMGGTLAAVASKSGAGEILAADHNESKVAALCEAHGCIASTAAEIAAEADYIFLGVKPQVMRAAAEEIRGILAARQEPFAVVSMAAGMTAADVSEMLGGAPVIRIMPNTPAAVGEGVILYCLGAGVTGAQETDFLALLGPAGELVRLDESKIDMGSALTGCGPAFVCLLMEAMTDAGVRCGLPRDKALQFAAQMMKGSAELLLEENMHPAVLKDRVCSPGGSTIQGVRRLEESGFRAAAMDAVIATFEKKF